ncbi:MAG TPA: YraN family protein [Verrucomicrobiae bacterium]|nr:YraN family protein [Verrucomicrobiae bacterium]
MDARKEDGRRGEDLAAAFFIAKGFEIVGRNWNHRLGEIDLIISRAGEIRFVEVKYRRSLTYGRPEESITGAKLRHLERAILLWLETQKPVPKRYQADALAITELPGSPIEYTWIEQIFG